MPNAATLTADARENVYVERALQQLPAYTQAVELRGKVLQAQRELRGAGVVPSPVDPDHLDDFLASVATHAADQLAFDAQRNALVSLRGQVDNRIASLLASNSEPVLGSISNDLTQLMDEIGAAVTELGGATDAAEAIAAGTENAWRKLPSLRMRYDMIRAAQKSVVAASFDATLVLSARSQHHVDDPMASDLVLANLDEIMPGWRRADARFAMGGRAPDRRPWPEEPIEQLVWLSASPALPWIPTAQQLHNLHTERRERLNTNTDDDAQPRIVNRHNQPVPQFTAINHELAEID